MKRRFSGLGAFLALVLTAGLVLPTAAPARADFPIIGDVQAVLGIVNQVRSSFDSVIHYLTDPAKPPSDLDQMRAAIAASTTAINSQIDAHGSGRVYSACHLVLIEFADINSKAGDQLEAFRHDAVDCVTTAVGELNASTTPAALDADALALNVGAPIALAASRKAGDATDGLILEINDGNRALLAKPQLKPTCGAAPAPGVDVHALTLAATGTIPGTGGEAPIPGRGACYNYMVTPPQLTQGHVLYYPTGPNTGALPWTVTGDGHEEFCSGVFTCGRSTVMWPSTATWDFSIAADQAMAATSYPIVRAALDKLAPLCTAAGQPVSMLAESANGPIDIFGVTPAGKLLRGTLIDAHNGNFGQGTFQGWTDFGTPSFVSGAGGPGFTLKSVASAVNYNGKVQVFALDRLGNIFSSRQINPLDDGSWTPWAHLEGTLTSIAAARNDDGRLQLFGSTPDGTVVTRYQALNTQAESAGPYVPQGSNIHPALDTWTPWQATTGGGGATQVAAITRGTQINLFVVNHYGQLEARHQNTRNAAAFQTGNWSDWAEVTAPTEGGWSIPLRNVQPLLDRSSAIILVVTGYGSRQYNRLLTEDGWSRIPGAMYGGIGATTEGGSFGADEMFGVDGNGDVFYAYGNGISQGRMPNPWSGWVPVGGAKLRAYDPGAYAGPVLQPIQAVGATRVLTWTDESTNEDAFVLWRFTTSGQFVSSAADLATANKAGTGDTVTFTDTTPDANAPCYLVRAYDFAGLFGASSSDLVCP